MSSKRHSILPAVDRSGPKPPVIFSSSLTISGNALLQGTHSITMQSETVIHPRSRFESHFGSILVGRRCLIYERAHLGARPSDVASTRGGIALGDYVTVEAGCIVEAGGTEIGECTLVQAGAKIGCGAKIGKNCTITPKSIVPPGAIIPDGTVIFSKGKRRTDQRDSYDQRKLSMVKQLGVLRKMIPSDPDKFK
ncbi:trimeric LpxA-like protein [Mariannaea sp. PMI_226]|nr:trimeric LpxA-like protein [Mariannaea sp. PMI_226]